LTFMSLILGHVNVEIMTDRSIDQRITGTMLIALMIIKHVPIAEAFLAIQTTSNPSSMLLQSHPSRSNPDRRGFLSNAALAFGLLGSTMDAQARGLVMFPCDKPLGNTYHFLRAGVSLIEEEHIWSTNPLFLTNREAALSDQGILQIKDSIQFLKASQINPTVCRYSLAAAAIDTADLVGEEMKLGRDRLVPEFNYMDPRAIGKWDMQPLTTTEYAVWAMDADEGGRDGKGGLPPPNEDSTPHETLHDQSTRLRQLMSVLESQYSGDTVLLIFPDGTGPALLSAMIAGIPLNRVHELEFTPGEVRLNVTLDTTLSLWHAKQSDMSEYELALAEGRKELRRLRGMNDMVSIKDQRLEDDRIALEAQLEHIQAAKTKANEKQQTAQKARARDMDEKNQPHREERDAKAGSSSAVGKASSKSENSNLPVAKALGTLLVGSAAILVTAKDMVTVELPIKNTSKTDDHLDFLLESEAIISAPNEKEKVVSLRRPTDSAVDGLEAVAPQVLSAMYTALPRAEPAVSAQNAMDEYLDSDDGGDAWL
jgi:broad specificity phosphatase PhoE